jgi:type III secretion protein V
VKLGHVLIDETIVAGLIIDITSKGMDVSKALETYSILTIDERLASQIPALLIAVTFRVIIARVASSACGALGHDIGKQVFAQPNALLVAGAMVVLMVLIPRFLKILL